MALWLPVLKASLPYITQIVTAAIPAFTRKSSGEMSDDLVARQISELQSAATSNAESVKGLATQLKETIETIDAGAPSFQAELIRTRQLAFVSILVAAVSLLVALLALLAR